MANLKKTNVYYFSVEGETEKWYLDWLAETINNTENSIANVKIKRDVQKDPEKYVKKLKIISKTNIYHLSDYESNDQEHITKFYTTIDKLKKASSVKQVKYEFGYSNYAFDLWVILHKMDAFGSVADRKQYIKLINKAFDENFDSMDEYKEEKNFKRCLSKIEFSDIINAVNRSKKIMQRNTNNGYTLHQYKGYSFYRENPSLTVWEPIERILKDCKLI